MDYEKKGILASIDHSENLVIVKDFEIPEDLIMFWRGTLSAHPEEISCLD